MTTQHPEDNWTFSKTATAEEHMCTLLQCIQNIDSLNRPSTHTLAMTLRKTHEHVMEFGPDQSYDMFQVPPSTIIP